MQDLPRIPSRTMKVSPRTSKSPDSERKDAIPRMPQRFTSSAINEPRSIVIQGIEDIQYLLEESSRDSVSAMSGSCEGNLPSATTVSRSDSSISETVEHVHQRKQLSPVGTSHFSADDFGKVETTKSRKSETSKSPPQVSTRKTRSKSDKRSDHIHLEKPTEFGDKGAGTSGRPSPTECATSDSSPSRSTGRGPVMKQNPLIIKVTHEKERPKSYIKSRRYPSLDRRSRRNSVCRSLSSIVESDDEYSFSPVVDLRKKQNIKVALTLS